MFLFTLCIKAGWNCILKLGKLLIFKPGMKTKNFKTNISPSVCGKGYIIFKNLH